MEYTGNILKMRSQITDDSGVSDIRYTLPVGDTGVDINSLIDLPVRIEYKSRINCIYCGRLTKKSFAQGYCYPCFISLPQTDACTLHPEKCEAHIGISRDLAWSEENCLTNHIVYLSSTPGLKVGVTRESQVPTRWIDQGAWEAIKVAKTPNRFLAGRIEVFLKGNVADKTNWRKMLSGERLKELNLEDEKKSVLDLLPPDLSGYKIEDNSITQLSYPVKSYPEKIKSMNLDTSPVVEGVITGIKGQYLLFGSGEVINIRKHGGYYISLSY